MWQDDEGNDMEWCSIPERGKKLYCNEWIDTLPQKIVNNNELLSYLGDIEHTLNSIVFYKESLKDIQMSETAYQRKKSIARQVYSQFTIFEINDDKKND